MVMTTVFEVGTQKWSHSDSNETKWNSYVCINIFLLSAQFPRLSSNPCINFSHQ